MCSACPEWRVRKVYGKAGRTDPNKYVAELTGEQLPKRLRMQRERLVRVEIEARFGKMSNGEWREFMKQQVEVAKTAHAKASGVTTSEETK